MKEVHISWAKKNGFETDYNKPVTKERMGQPDKFHWAKFPVAYCPVCERAFDTRQSNGKGNKNNKLLKPKYLPGWFPTLDLDRSLCGFDKCYNKPN